MSLLIPAGFRTAELRHLYIGSGNATGGSVSIAAPGTGMVYVPVFAWGCASGTLTRMTAYNGTAGSQTLSIITQIGGVEEVAYWEEPSKMSANKALAIDIATGGGNSEFHVWAIAVRAGAGNDALGQ